MTRDPVGTKFSFFKWFRSKNVSCRCKLNRCRREEKREIKPETIGRRKTVLKTMMRCWLAGWLLVGEREGGGRERRGQCMSRGVVAANESVDRHVPIPPASLTHRSSAQMPSDVLSETTSPRYDIVAPRTITILPTSNCRPRSRGENTFVASGRPFVCEHSPV